jgi:predicted ATPase
VEGLDAASARSLIRVAAADIDDADLLLLDDLLGIADPDAVLPPIDPDARRRRLTALVNTAALSRQSPAVSVVEDTHWIEAVSESMLAEFLTVVTQARLLVLLTYRPEYQGALTRVSGARPFPLRLCGLPR